MARIIAGMGSPHAPAVGAAVDRRDEQSEYWKPLFDGYGPMREWLEREKPDVIILFTNDHFTSFFLDVIPTFAIAVADRHEIADEVGASDRCPRCPAIRSSPLTFRTPSSGTDSISPSATACRSTTARSHRCPH
jgi:hypothetical protein